MILLLNILLTLFTVFATFKAIQYSWVALDVFINATDDRNRSAFYAMKSIGFVAALMGPFMAWILGFKFMLVWAIVAPAALFAIIAMRSKGPNTQGRLTNTVWIGYATLTLLLFSPLVWENVKDIGEGPDIQIGWSALTFQGDSDDDSVGQPNTDDGAVDVETVLADDDETASADSEFVTQDDLEEAIAAAIAAHLELNGAASQADLDVLEVRVSKVEETIIEIKSGMALSLDEETMAKLDELIMSNLNILVQDFEDSTPEEIAKWRSDLKAVLDLAGVQKSDLQEHLAQTIGDTDDEGVAIPESDMSGTIEWGQAGCAEISALADETQLNGEALNTWMNNEVDYALTVECGEWLFKIMGPDALHGAAIFSDFIIESQVMLVESGYAVDMDIEGFKLDMTTEERQDLQHTLAAFYVANPDRHQADVDTMRGLVKKFESGCLTGDKISTALTADGLTVVEVPITKRDACKDDKVISTTLAVSYSEGDTFLDGTVATEDGVVEIEHDNRIDCGGQRIKQVPEQARKEPDPQPEVEVEVEVIEKVKNTVCVLNAENEYDEVEVERELTSEDIVPGSNGHCPKGTNGADGVPEAITDPGTTTPEEKTECNAPTSSSSEDAPEECLDEGFTEEDGVGQDLSPEAIEILDLCDDGTGPDQPVETSTMDALPEGWIWVGFTCRELDAQVDDSGNTAEETDEATSSPDEGTTEDGENLSDEPTNDDFVGGDI